MRRFIRTIAILTLLGLSIYGYKKKAAIPAPRAKMPTTRYHGYDLNMAAIDRVRSYTVLISREDFGSVGRGTGVLIDPTHVLTCAHMVEGPQDDLWIFPYPGHAVVKGRPVFVSRGADLAVLELNARVVVPHYAVFQDTHYDGEPITVIGNTMGCMRWFVTFGIVSGEYAGNFLLTDAILYGGNSGGPWLNEHGEVVALTDFTFVVNDKESAIHGGVSARTIHAFLEEWKAPSIFDVLFGKKK